MCGTMTRRRIMMAGTSSIAKEYGPAYSLQTENLTGTDTVFLSFLFNVNHRVAPMPVG